MRKIATRMLSAVAGTGAALLVAATAAAQQGQPGQGFYGPGMHGSWHGPGTWWGPFMGIFMLIAVVAVIVGGILVLRHFWHVGDRAGERGGAAGQARAILDERYARGEIDREEYLRRRRDLEGTDG